MDDTAERLEEEIGFLRNSEIFGRLSTEELKIILDGGKIETHSPGSTIFRIGDPSDAIYVIKSGVVEICRAKGDRDKISVVAYLGESDPIGEMAITTGSSRGSLARVPQMAEMLKIEKGAFMDLLSQIPELSISLLAILSKRLEDGLRKQRAAARYQHLSGKLEYFDLPTIIQTLATTERTGTLTITDQVEGVFAVLYFDAGKILYAKLGHLRGEEAFYQLFQSPIQDAFTFKGGLPPGEFEEEEEIGTTTMGLLLEATHQQDELKVLKSSYSDSKRVSRPQSKTLSWDDKETRDLAREIWARLRRGETIAQMVREISTCEYRIYKVLSIMNEKGLVG
ncbi:MAG: cyclic nucleotide-binding domain-containing protein [Syntrophobacterales bacterium]|nr:MAG: cyclic nucleotide-binding domain-containing protein [Syntrophobacterales bacterium]